MESRACGASAIATASPPGLRAGAVAIVLGTRPEIIKLAPVVHHLGAHAQIVHTGQHYDPNIDAELFTESCLPRPAVRLAIGGLPRAAQIGKATAELDQLFRHRRPGAVIVHGDTNSAVAGALAANALSIPLVHVEAGLRSFDRRMPEEHNRTIIDHLADLLCAPTPGNAANLRREGLPDQRIIVTGNTTVEAVHAQLPNTGQRERILSAFGLHPGRYVLATIHRQENVDPPANLQPILSELATIGRTGWPVLLPLHPRTEDAMRRLGRADLLTHLQVIEPQPHRTFLALAKHAALLISDSGGLQEEATILKRPLLVVRRSTERPEATSAFATLVPPGHSIAQIAAEWLPNAACRTENLATIPSPYGDGTAAQRIAAHTLLLANSATNPAAEGVRQGSIPAPTTPPSDLRAGHLSDHL